MIEEDRELLQLMSQVGTLFRHISLGVLENSLNQAEQLAFGHRLVDLAVLVRDRALRTGGIVVEGSIDAPTPGIPAHSHEQ